MNANLIIKRLGGTQAVARLFDIKAPSVSEWRHNGIPRARLQYIQLAWPHALKPQTKDEAADANNDS